MTQSLTRIKKDFTEGLSQISRFWGFPKGMGAHIFKGTWPVLPIFEEMQKRCDTMFAGNA